MKVYFPVLRNYRYAHNAGEPKYFGVYQNKEKAVEAIYKHLIIDENILSGIWSYHRTTDMDQFREIYPVISSFDRFEERMRFCRNDSECNSQFLEDLLVSPILESYINDFRYYVIDVLDFDLV